MGSKSYPQKHHGIHMPSRLLKKIKNKFKPSDQNKPEKTTAEQNSSQADSRSPSITLDDKIVSEKRAQSSQIAVQTTSTDLWEEALEKARQSPDWKENQCQYDEAVQESRSLNQSLLEDTNRKDGSLADAIATHLDSLREKHSEKQWAYEGSDGEIIYFRDVVARIVRWISVFNDPGNLLAGLDPTKAASLVWGFVQFFVERSITYSETRDLALDQEPIANLISRYALVEKFYLDSTPGAPTETYEAVKSKIIELYATIILYQLAIYKFWKQGKITHGIQSLVPHKLKELSNAIQTKSAQVDSALHLNDRELLQNIFENVQLKEPIAEVGCQLQQVLDIVTNLEERKYSDVLEWVSPIRYLDHHNMIKPMGGTGQWLLEHPECIDWRQSQHSSLFWLRGKMGAGKTNLVSTLISHLLDSSPDDQERKAFFYIDNANRANEAKSAELILNALLKQLAIQGGNRLMQPVVAKYDQLHNSSSLHQEDCIALITSIVREYRQTNIIIDAIDELEDDDVRTDLLESLKQVVDRSESALVKIFISSRDQVNIATIMDAVWYSRRELIVGERNYEDISRFITGRVEVLGKALSRPIPDKVRRNVESLLKERANGMFLWVHLSLEYLRKIKAKDPDTFVAKLQSAPPDIQGLYFNILTTITKDQDSEGSGTIQRILSFLVYGWYKEIFKSRAFLSAINYNADQEDSKLSAKDLLDLCSPFVELDPRKKEFRLIHFSVKEFLQTQPGYKPEAAHGRLATQCLTCLQGQRHIRIYRGRLKREKFNKYDFGYYASETWVFHCAGAGTSRHSPPLADILQVFWPGAEHGKESTFDRWVKASRDFYYADDFLGRIICGALDSLIVDSRPTAFFLACQYNLREVIEALLDQGWDINQSTGNGSGLSFACSNGHLELASYLIDHGARIAVGKARESNNDSRGRPRRRKMIESPLVATMESGDPRILELLLRQGGPKPMQAAMESALRERSKDQQPFGSPSTSKPVVLMNRQIDIMLNHFPDFEYSADVQQEMFRGGAKLTEMLLARNSSLRVTDETLQYLFNYVRNSQEAKDIIQCLLPLDHDFVASESFTSALKFYHGDRHARDKGDEDALELIEYTLKLNGSDPAILISEETLRTAIDRAWNGASFTKALLKSHSSLKISDDLIRWVVRKGSLGIDGCIIIIDVLLRHDPSPRGFSQSELKELLPSFRPSKMLALLVSSVPDLEVDQELFTRAVDDVFSVREDLELLLDRAPNIALSAEMIKSTNFAASDWAISQVAASIPPASITDDILRAAVVNWCTFAEPGVESVSLTLKELMQKAPSGLMLSEETYHAAYESSSWACQQVLQRWPSGHAITAGLQSVYRFRTLIEIMPSVEISSASIASICKDRSNLSAVETVEGILAFQPNTAVTEDMLLAVAESGDYSRDMVRLFQILLQHEPHAHLTEKVVERVMVSTWNALDMLKIILDARPHLEFNPLSMSMFRYKRYLDFEKCKKTLNEALERSKSFRLDEREMLDMMAKCTPDGLGVVLSARPDAVVTERVIEQLVSNRTCKWECGCECEAFDVLLDRAGVLEAQRQSWKARFPDVRVHESQD